mmetsp:Transcript_26101/g.51223  ORF Transcript_26101/g.51223 Transcript_26101/m.51223 type:complete len:312 (-) Transcript_26101:411-1346(-)
MRKLHAGCSFEVSESLQGLHLQTFQMFLCVQVRERFADRQVEFEFGTIPLDRVVSGNFPWHLVLYSQSSCRLEGPAPGHISDSVPPPSEDQKGNPKGPAEGETLSVTTDRQVETTKAVTCQRICPTLQDDGFWSKFLHTRPDYRFEETQKRGVVHAVIQRQIQRVVLSNPVPHIRKVPCPRKEVPEFVQRESQYPVCTVEGLLHPVTMVDVDVDVHHPGVVFQELQDAQDNVVEIAEPGGLTLLGMVQTPRPVYGDVCVSPVQEIRSVDRGPRTRSLKFKQALKNRTVVTDTEIPHVVQPVAFCVFRRDFA